MFRKEFRVNLNYTRTYIMLQNQPMMNIEVTNCKNAVPIPTRRPFKENKHSVIVYVKRFKIHLNCTSRFVSNELFPKHMRDSAPRKVPRPDMLDIQCKTSYLELLFLVILLL